MRAIRRIFTVCFLTLGVVAAVSLPASANFVPKTDPHICCDTVDETLDKLRY